MSRRGFTLLELLLVVALLGILAATVVPLLIRSRIAANEATTLADTRAFVTAQAAYRAVNADLFEARLQCLATPVDNQCLPFYPANAPPFLEVGLTRPFDPWGDPWRVASLESGPTRLADRSGYRRFFTAGPAPTELSASASPTSVLSYVYDATPLVIGQTGVRGFAGDGSGRICYTPDGTPVGRPTPTEMDLACEVFE